MACLNPDGTLTAVARRVLTALEPPAADQEVAQRADLPLYRVRASLREMGTAKLVATDGDSFRITEIGLEALELDSEDA
jgi:DNA-binding IclR family transcriptional regulator